MNRVKEIILDEIIIDSIKEFVSNGFLGVVKTGYDKKTNRLLYSIFYIKTIDNIEIIKKFLFKYNENIYINKAGNIIIPDFLGSIIEIKKSTFDIKINN